MIAKGVKLAESLRVRAKWTYGELGSYLGLDYTGAKKLCVNGKQLDPPKWTKLHDLWVALGGDSRTFADAVRAEAEKTARKKKGKDPLGMLEQLVGTKKKGEQ